MDVLGIVFVVAQVDPRVPAAADAVAEAFAALGHVDVVHAGLQVGDGFLPCVGVATDPTLAGHQGSAVGEEVVGVLVTGG